MLHCLSKNDSTVQDLLSFLRDRDRHSNRELFRLAIEKLGFILGYELSKTLEYQDSSVRTPLATAQVRELKRQPIIGSILRAGLPLHNGMLQAFPQADNCFIGAYRKHNEGGGFSIQLDYLATPNLAGRTLILTDPMLATGASLICTLQRLFATKKPERLYVVSVIAAQAGIDHLSKSFPSANIWTAAIDAELNQHSYIVPGLGDAGDLSFGE